MGFTKNPNRKKNNKTFYGGGGGGSVGGGGGGGGWALQRIQIEKKQQNFFIWVP